MKKNLSVQNSLNGILLLETLSLIKVKMLRKVKFGILLTENNEIENFFFFSAFNFLFFCFIHYSIRKNQELTGLVLVSADIY